MLVKFIQLINLIQRPSDVDAFLIYPVLVCVLLSTIFIFKVLANTHKQKELHKFELVEISKNIECLMVSYNQNHFSKKDFQKRQEELFDNFEVLKSHWLGLNLVIKSINHHSKIFTQI